MKTKIIIAPIFKIFNRCLSALSLIWVLIASSACSSVPDQPRWMGDVRRQETSHQFPGATVPQLMTYFEQAFLFNEFGIKEINTMNSSLTATRNTRDGYITSTVYFYQTEQYVTAKMVTMANTETKLGDATNTTIVNHVSHGPPTR